MSTALAALVEALDFSDVIAEIGEANWRELFEGMTIERLPTAREFAQGIPIVLAPVAGGGLTTVIERIRNPHRPARLTRNINHTHIEARTPNDVPLPGGNVPLRRGTKRKKKALSGRPTRFHRRNPVTSVGIDNNTELDRLIGRVKRTRSRSTSRGPNKATRKSSTFRYSMPAGVRARRKKRTPKRRIHRRISTGVRTNYLAKTRSHGNGTITKTKSFLCPAPEKFSGATAPVGTINNSHMTVSSSPPSVTGQGSFGWNFQLMMFPNFSAYQGMYRFFRIDYVKIIFYPQQNAYAAYDGGGNSAFNSAAPQIKSFAPEIIVASDQMTDAVFANRLAAHEKEGSVYHMFNDSKEFAVTLKPTVKQLSGPANAQVVVPGKPMWVPTTASTLEHFGLRVYLDNFNQYVSLRTIMTMKISFRGLKGA